MGPAEPRPCPSLEALDGFVAGGSRDPDIVAHLASCPPCRRVAEGVQANARFLDGLPAPGRLGALPRVDGYEIVRELRRGGQGVVYEAVQAVTNRRVGVKLMRPDVVLTPAARDRFQREVELAASLSHPNIVTVHEGGQTGEGRLFLVMELIDGVPLDEHLERSCAAGQAPALALLAGVARAVGYAHARGVVHRDLSPSNILVDDRGTAHVVDFGLAKALAPEGAATVTRTGQFVGTLAFASPEHLSGRPDTIGPASDVYALGVVLYRALTGTMPYPVDGRLDETILVITGADPAPLRVAGRRLGGDVEAVVMKALAKAPADRYPTAGALADDLERLLEGGPVAARRRGPLARARRWVRRRGAGPIAAVLGVVTVAWLAAAVARTALDRARETRRQEATALFRQLDPRADEAEQAALLDRVLAVDDRFAEAYLARGRLLAQDRIQEAARQANIEVPKGPARAARRFEVFRARVKVGLEDFERAAACAADIGLRKRALVEAGNAFQHRLATGGGSGLEYDRWAAVMMHGYYDRAIAVDPGDPSLRVLALAAYAAGDRRQDLAVAEIARLDRDDGAVRGLTEFWRAQAHVFLGGPRHGWPRWHPHRDLSRALAATDKLTSVLEPASGRAWYLHGLILRELGRHREAIEACRAAIERLGTDAPFDVTNPDNWLAPAKANLATCLSAVGRHEEAWPEFRDAFDLSGPTADHPDNRTGSDGRSPLVLIDWAEAEAAAGDPGAARARVRQALDIVLEENDAGIPSRVVPVAWALLSFPDPGTRDPTAAAALLERMRAYGRMLDDATVTNLLALALVLSGEPDRAARLCEGLPAEDLESPYALCVLALIDRERGDADRARERLARARAAAGARDDPRLRRLVELCITDREPDPS